MRRIAVVLNTEAGTLRRLPLAETVRRLRALFLLSGIEAVVTAGAGRACPELLRAAFTVSSDAVVVGGGDGTVLMAATLACETGRPLGILPLGTMNLLARDLGVPAVWEEAVPALAHAPVRRMDVGEVNGRLFLNASVLGLYPGMIAGRERRRLLWGLGKWPAMVLAAVRAVLALPRLRVRIDDGTGEIKVTTPVLAVANNAYDEGLGAFLRRSTLDSGRLAVYLARHDQSWSVARLMVGLVLGTWQRNPQLETRSVEHLIVRSSRHRLKVANDGEIIRLTPPLVYRVRPAALAVLAPGCVRVAATATGAGGLA